MSLVQYNTGFRVSQSGEVSFAATQMRQESYELLEATSRDVPEIVDIVNEAFRTCCEFRKLEADRTNLADVSREIQEPGSLRWLVMKSTHNVLYKNGIMQAKRVAATLLYQADETIGHLHMVAAHKTTRGTGVGSKLIRSAVRHAMRSGKEKVMLWCADDPKLVKHYEKCGFTKTGTEGTYDSVYLKPEFHGKIKTIEMQYVIDPNKVVCLPVK